MTIADLITLLQSQPNPSAKVFIYDQHEKADREVTHLVAGSETEVVLWTGEER